MLNGLIGSMTKRRESAKGNNMRGAIQEISFSQGGKLKLKIEGKWYFSPNNDDPNLKPGVTLGFDAGQFEFKNKYYDRIDKYEVIRADTSSSGYNPPIHASPQTQTPAATPETYISEPEMRFISNVVGQAIVSKTITDPMDILAWAKAAQGAISALKVL